MLDVLNSIPDMLKGLGENLPKILEDFAGVIGEVLATSFDVLVTELPQIIAALISVLVDPRTWIDVVLALVDGFVTGIKDAWAGWMGGDAAGGGGVTSGWGDWWEGVKETATSWVEPQASYATGTPYIPKTGVYKLHEGERVESAARARASASRPSSGGGAIASSGGMAYLPVDIRQLLDALSRESGRGIGVGNLGSL